MSSSESPPPPVDQDNAHQDQEPQDQGGITPRKPTSDFRVSDLQACVQLSDGAEFSKFTASIRDLMKECFNYKFLKTEQPQERKKFYHRLKDAYPQLLKSSDVLSKTDIKERKRMIDAYLTKLFGAWRHTESKQSKRIDTAAEGPASKAPASSPESDPAAGASSSIASQEVTSQCSRARDNYDSAAPSAPSAEVNNCRNRGKGTKGSAAFPTSSSAPSPAATQSRPGIRRPRRSPSVESLPSMSPENDPSSNPSPSKRLRMTDNGQPVAKRCNRTRQQNAVEITGCYPYTPSQKTKRAHEAVASSSRGASKIPILAKFGASTAHKQASTSKANASSVASSSSKKNGRTIKAPDADETKDQKLFQLDPEAAGILYFLRAHTPSLEKFLPALLLINSTLPHLKTLSTYSTTMLDDLWLTKLRKRCSEYNAGDSAGGAQMRGMMNTGEMVAPDDTEGIILIGHLYEFRKRYC